MRKEAHNSVTTCPHASLCHSSIMGGGHPYRNSMVNLLGQCGIKGRCGCCAWQSNLRGPPPAKQAQLSTISRATARRRQRRTGRITSLWHKMPLPPPGCSLPNVVSNGGKMAAQHETDAQLSNQCGSVAAPQPLQSGGLAATGGGGGGLAPMGTGGLSQLRQRPSLCTAAGSSIVTATAAACAFCAAFRAPCALAKSWGVWAWR